MTCPRSDWCAERAAVSMRSTAIGTVCSLGLSMNPRVHPSCARLLRCASCSCTSIALMTCPRSDWYAERAAVSMTSSAIGTACSPGLSMNQRVHPSYARLLRCASCSCTSIALMTHAQDQTGVQSEQLYEKHCNRHCLQSRPEHKSESASLVHPPPPLCILQPHQHCINDMPKIRLVCRASSCEYEKHCNRHCLQPRPERKSESASLVHPPSPLCVLQLHQHCINDMPKIRLVCRASSCEYEKHCNRHCLQPRHEYKSESASLVHPPPPLCVLQPHQHCINDMPKIRLVCRAGSCEYEKHCNRHCLQPRPEHESESASLMRPPPLLCVLQLHQHCINGMPKIRLVCRVSRCEYEKHCNRHCLQPRPEHESESASLVRPSPPLCVLQMLQHCIPGTWPRSDWCAEGAAVSMRSTAIGTACSPGLSINRRVHLFCAHLPRCASCSCTSIALMTCPRSDWYAE
ncbi:hypothetical protein NDU88_008465 [Pleurodeles waltl]|uniref:Uncharacterized protein n=1 Tax=Pleurodeles waltl TaxID=8319 RepID=A0AAV7N798_PLEWA|nr:hypothetical protein NDU88_008465 [Pleurodeles waltl]